MEFKLIFSGFFPPLCFVQDDSSFAHVEILGKNICSMSKSGGMARHGSKQGMEQECIRSPNERKCHALHIDVLSNSR